ncbi:MAG: hypothetical protein LBV08_11690, partial [Clostridiales bacterium]|nr:hypothetical protein [Clostridiales bacterium]
MKKLFLALIFTLMLISCKNQANQIPLSLTPENYPRVDGSTATLPLAISLRSKITGENIKSLKLSTSHTKTNDSFYELINDNTDLLLVYTP